MSDAAEWSRADMPYPNRSVEDRIWSKVRKGDGCWLWVGAQGSDGYGVAWHDGRHQGAHRVAWQLAHGPIPNGLLVLHACDTPLCVYPAHLFLGTHQDNAADRDRKGRGHAKLSAADVAIIRVKVQSGISQRRIAAEFHISQSHVSLIASGICWPAREVSRG